MKKKGVCKAGAILDRFIYVGAILGGAISCGGPLYVYGVNMACPLTDMLLHAVLYWKAKKIINIGWIMVIYQLLDVWDIDANYIGKQTTQVILQ